MTDARLAAVVVLAAGLGTRMRSGTAKVLHEIAGSPLIDHVLAAVAPLDAERTLVVIGHDADAVAAHVGAVAAGAQIVVQDEQRGTGHAVRTALTAAGDLEGTVVVVPGDAPLLTAQTLGMLVAAHSRQGDAGTVLTAVLPDPTGYGRIVRGDEGAVTAIVEDRDADMVLRAGREVNTGVYVFAAAALRAALSALTTDNDQGEEYLTDAVAHLVAAGLPVGALTVADYRETLGVNDRAQLAEVGRALRDRILDGWMRAGVTIVDPATTWMDTTVTAEPDVTVLPNTALHGRTHLAAGAVAGPGSTLTDTLVGAGARVSQSVAEGAEIGPGAQVGPFSYLRPGTRLGPRAKAGAYVEIKNAVVGADSKVPHLSYVGDATIGERTNIGAATVFVNYDGEAKHRTTVGDDVRVGSDTMLVAPVTVGDGAYTAAGSVITEDVPAGAMGIGRSRQRNVDGWVERRRPGTPAAEAARRDRARTRGGTPE